VRNPDHWQLALTLQLKQEFNNMKNKQYLGFTLIELLVVIAIIGLLASVVVTSLSNARVKSRDTQRVESVRQIITALELYFNHNNTYPTATVTRLWDGVSQNIPDPAGGVNTTWGAVMPSYPSAALPIDNPTICTPANSGFAYSGTPTTYSISFCLGGASGSLSAGAHTATQSGFQ
jgi:prepilin-type N-terminal cleavage/methylation domain-containing protein